MLAAKPSCKAQRPARMEPPAASQNASTTACEVRNLQQHRLGGAQQSLAKLIDPFRRVHQPHVVIGGRPRSEMSAASAIPWRHQRIAHQTDISAREKHGAQPQIVTVVVDQLKRQHGRRPSSCPRSRMKSGTANSARPYSVSARPFRQALARLA